MGGDVLLFLKRKVLNYLFFLLTKEKIVYMCIPSLMYFNSLVSSMFLTSEGAVALFRHDEKGQLKYCGSMLGNTVFLYQLLVIDKHY